MLALFALTIFVGSSLLFLVEPMFAKMVLPLLGGTPAVWNTCMVFFQGALLAGYAYVHILSGRIGLRKRVLLHLLVMIAPAFLLPVSISSGWTPPRSANPIPWLMLLMSATVGLPFVAASATAPMMQKWFSATDHKAAKDPYFLYAASNLGSFTGLIGYLVVFEPHFTLAQQSRIWQWGYIVLIALMACCAACVLKAPRKKPVVDDPEGRTQEVPEPEELCLSRRLRWVALAAVPSSLMLGVTTYITTDIGSVPLLWVVPLSLYLITFMIAFGRRSAGSGAGSMRILPMLVLLQTVVLARVQLSLPWLPMIHLLTFFTAALLCHRALAEDRPSTGHLTHFYLLISLGGVLGGMFNALIAPVAFKSVAEYPIALVLACVLCLGTAGKARGGGPKSAHLADILVPTALGAVTLAACRLMAQSGPQVYAPVAGAIAIFCYSLVDRPLRFGLALAAVLLVITSGVGKQDEVIHQERSFFGVLRVTFDPGHHMNALIHGNTLHGEQSLDPDRRREPLRYFHPTGPVGQVFETFGKREIARSVAVVGLGAGSLACYPDKGQSMTFYEIDPAVEKVASDPRFFTFLADCRDRGVRLKTVLGDARLTLSEAPDRCFGMIVLDAFSSDSIPVHLVTRQAFGIYLRKLQEHGLLAFHITNRCLELTPVVGNLAADAGLTCLMRKDTGLTVADLERGKAGSKWVVMARHAEDLAPLAADPRWKRIERDPSAPIWTDDFSNILGVISWGRSVRSAR